MAPRQPVSHVGVAFHTVPGFPTQWSIVFSQSQQFEGEVWCATIIETTNGRTSVWTHLDWSPSRLDLMALFSGVVWITESTHSVNVLQNSVHLRGIISEIDSSNPYVWNDIGRDSEKFVSLVLWSIFQKRYVNLPEKVPSILILSIRRYLYDLQAAGRPDQESYPVLSIKTGKTTYARAMLL
jgi:hypothetical protein